MIEIDVTQRDHSMVSWSGHSQTLGSANFLTPFTGEVITMDVLKFQLREFDVEGERFTGHDATFSIPWYSYLPQLVAEV